MSDDEKFTVKYGNVELKTFQRFENGRMSTYHYHIEYDRDGKEILRTKPESYGYIGFDNGADFTEDDYNLYAHGIEKPIKGFLGWLLNKLRGF